MIEFHPGIYGENGDNGEIGEIGEIGKNGANGGNGDNSDNGDNGENHSYVCTEHRYLHMMYLQRGISPGRPPRVHMYLCMNIDIFFWRGGAYVPLNSARVVKKEDPTHQFSNINKTLY